jgi:hypothetical protein
MKKGFGCNGILRLILLFIFAVINIAFSFYKIFKYEESLYSHLFGSIAGFLVGVAVLKDTGRNIWKPIVRCIGCSLYVLMLIFFIEFNLIKAYLID